MGNTNAPATEAESSPPPSPSPAKEEQGKLIGGRYRLEEKMLGSGAFAVVKLGTDVVENKPVAIRIIDKEKLTPVSMQYLRRELEIYPKLVHSNIVQCFYSKEGKKFVIMVTEYMPDGNLSTHLAKRAMVREVEAREIFDQVLSAVEYLYTINVAWRDLKCSNILLNLDKNLVKICDFGFADYADKPFTDFPGTMAYSPPEVVSATPYVGAAREVWSFGVLLYKLLTGNYPFGTKTNVATKERIIKEEPDFDLIFISDEGLDLLKQMLTKDPAKRIGLYDIRKHPWMTREHIISRRRAQSRSDVGPPTLNRRPSVTSLPVPIIKARDRSPLASPNSSTTVPQISPRVPHASPAGAQAPQISPRGAATPSSPPTSGPSSPPQASPQLSPRSHKSGREFLRSTSPSIQAALATSPTPPTAETRVRSKSRPVMPSSSAGASRKEGADPRPS